MIAKNPISFPDGDPRKKLAQYEQAVLAGYTEGMTKACIETERIARQTLNDLQKIDRGILRASIAHRVEVRATRVVGTIYDGAEHGIWVELGRAGTERNPTKDPRAAKPAWPPISKIYEWAVRKARVIAFAGRTASGRARRAKESQARSFAFLVARKIFRFGIKPTPHLVPAQEQVTPLLPKLIQDAIDARTKRR